MEKPKDENKDNTTVHENMENKEQFEKTQKNPYKVQALTRIAGLVFCMAGYLTVRPHVSLDYYDVFRTMSLVVISGLTLSIVPAVKNCFEYKKFKKKHPGKEFDSDYFEIQRAVDNHTYRGRR